MLAIALLGLLVPNGIFLYWLCCEATSVSAVFANHLAIGFMLDALLATGILAFLLAKRPAGPVAWPWFVVFALIGGLGFAIPFFLWLNFRRARSGGAPHASFTEWWRDA
ncbi:MAG: hypothetical protein ABIV06_06135 [Thermoanaerobaculia bacterium]